MKYTILIAFVALNIAACNNNKPEQDLSAELFAKSAADKENSAVATIPNNKLPQQIPTGQTAAMPQNAASVPQQVVTPTAPGMNPPHGQPGHRCDIKEGAPLNSAPAKAAKQPITTTSQSVNPSQFVSIPTPVNNVVTAKGMNPPHGEPGHRCDISVGAPLNSKSTNPTKPSTNNDTANITPLASTAQNNPIIPALQNSSITPAAPKAVTAFTGKINPAHGKPGHDCKVAVGQPLP